MSTDNINSWHRHASELIRQGSLREAISSLRGMIPARSWRIGNEIDSIEETYAMMLSYLVQSAADPERKRLYSSIVDRLMTVADRILRDAVTAESHHLYFSTLRYEQMQNETLSTLTDQYRRLQQKTSAFAFATSDKSTLLAERRQRENLERRIFGLVWTSFPLSADDIQTLRNLFADDSIPEYFKSLILSAILIGELTYHENARILLLLDIYDNCSSALAIKALCAFALAANTHTERMNAAQISDRLALLCEQPQFAGDLRGIYLLLVQTHNTERINRKMRDELLPGIMKLRPDIYSKLNIDPSELDIQSLEDNPEWEDMFRKSGLDSKFKELAELQEEGGDILMSTFSMLKIFPFFNEIANWFLPFHTEHSELDTPLRHATDLGELIEASRVLCDSDKYSFILALPELPEAQRKMMIGQLSAHNVNLAEIQNATLSTEATSRRNIGKLYIQDLYRFFNLFRRKNEFVSPFHSESNLLKIKSLQSCMIHQETLGLAAELLMRQEQYGETVDVINLISAHFGDDPALFQKKGFALQRMNRLDDAAEAYTQAELLHPGSIWTLKRLAHVYRLNGNSSKALEYYRILESKLPEDPKIALNIGHCLMERNELRDALLYYYKAEFLDENSTRAYRPIAWCAFLSRDFELSEKYYAKLGQTTQLTATDHLNIGHLNLARNQVADAIIQYRQAMEKGGYDTTELSRLLRADFAQLSTAGIDTDLIPMIIDNILYTGTTKNN